MSARIVDGVAPDPAHVALVRRVLLHAVAGEPAAAGRALDAVFAAGPVAVMTLISVAADTHIAAMERVHGLLPAGEAVQPVWVDVDTGRRFYGADDVDPVWRWAGRYVAARAAGDAAQCEALVNGLRELPPPVVVGQVGGLVQMCALAVRDAREAGRRR